MGEIEYETIPAGTQEGADTKITNWLVPLARDAISARHFVHHIDGRVSAILLTLAHWDHVSGVADFSRTSSSAPPNTAASGNRSGADKFSGEPYRYSTTY